MRSGQNCLANFLTSLSPLFTHDTRLRVIIVLCNIICTLGMLLTLSPRRYLEGEVAYRHEINI